MAARSASSPVAPRRRAAYRRRQSTGRKTVRQGRFSMTRQWMTRLSAVAVFGALTGGAWAQDACTNRGQLDTLYCDDNNDLVADAPKDQKKWRDPSVLVFAYTPVEDPAVYQNIFKPFTDYLGQCTGKRV